MIKLQAINNILDTKNIEKYLIEDITEDYFGAYKDEFNFIYQHYRAYNTVPDWETFMGKFPDFDVVEVLEPINYIIYHLKEDYLFEKGFKVFQDSANILEQDAIKGLENVVRESEDLLKANKIKYGTDIQDMADIFEQDIERKRKLNNEGIIGISSGFEELDEITHGWLPGNELVSIVGRINQGKSWLLQKFLAEANKQGKRVLMYSGEMSAKEVMYRHLTLKHNISNTQLITGIYQRVNREKLSSY